MPQSARRSKTDWRSCKETQPLELWVQDSKCSLLPDQLMLCRPFITIICLEILVSPFYCAEWKSSSAAVLNLSPNKYFSFHSPCREPSTATLLKWVPIGNVTALCSAQHTLPSTAKAAFCHFKQTAEHTLPAGFSHALAEINSAETCVHYMHLPESALWLLPYMANCEPRETSSLRIIQGPGAAVGLETFKSRCLYLPIFPKIQFQENGECLGLCHCAVKSSPSSHLCQQHRMTYEGKLQAGGERAQTTQQHEKGKIQERE